MSIESTIDSAVYSYAVSDKGKQDNSSWAEWTNLSRALDNAESGDKVVINKNATVVEVEDDSTIKAGVTLILNGKTLTVSKKTTLTIEGTLDLTDSGSMLEIAASEKDTDGKVIKAAGALDYTQGYVAYTDLDQIEKNDFKLSGAYYSVTTSGKTVKYLTSYDNGTADVLKADDRKVTFNDDGADAGIILTNIAISGSADKPANLTVVGSKLTGGTVTLENATVTISIDKAVDITFAPAAGYDTSNVVLKDSNGNVVSGMKIILSGTEETTFSYQLIGSTAASSTPSIVIPSQPSAESDDGMGLTEYLLIVLVVLAAILVVIVSMRMMRS